MIKLYELNAATRAVVEGLPIEQQRLLLDEASDAMLAIEMHFLNRGLNRIGIGENGAVELVIALAHFLETAPAMKCNRPRKGNHHE